MNKSSENIIHLKSFSKIPNLIHGFSTRDFGSMGPANPNSDKSLDSFSKSLGINPEKIIKMNQTHSKNVNWVNQQQAGQKINQTDGILTAEKNLYLAVVTADCIPVLILDKTKKYLGAVHAGWRGIESEILKVAINELVLKGSNPGDIMIGIGPCIRSCCYNIDQQRSDLLKNKFVNFTNFLEQREGKIFLNLSSLAKQQLLELKILPENIEDCGICTFDEPEKLYSFRRGDKTDRFIDIIGFKS